MHFINRLAHTFLDSNIKKDLIRIGNALKDATNLDDTFVKESYGQISKIEAEKDIEKKIKLLVDLSICIGDQFFENEDYVNAEIMYWISYENDDTSRLKHLGITKYFLGEYKSAIRYLTQANETQNYNSLSYLGASYFALNEYDKAEHYFTEALAHKRKPVMPLYNLGFLHQSLGNNEKAREFYNRVLYFQPNDVSALARLEEISDK